MSFIESLTAYQLDTLKEVGNIGSGNAATSLSALLNQKVDMTVPAVRIVDFDQMMDLVGGPDTLIVSVYLRIQGDAPGNMFFVLSPSEAETFVREMTGIDSFTVDTPPLDEMGLSALQELGNILAGSYLSALSDFINVLLQPSVPLLHIDMAGAILTQGLMELSQESDYAIIIDTIINEQDNENDPIKGHFFLLPDPESFPKIFDRLGVED
ncbi:CheY-P phosphatase CheC [Paraliobacillus quinghaiensis]|uniref:CheY-P phosphatase CheC n=1 Tax=Paraliobacillus quinghaiensis TaxID=470815 RepID=A0A917WQW2_9BACI|nr:chemotaxis protein CheC [Paraliobacillus quinghaiensis]GGM21524.1 CheY-P phosphatase CheC [Paraliobacillus quinghaiensis]